MSLQITKIVRWSTAIVFHLLAGLLLVTNVQAAKSYTPGHVFSGVEYANQMADRMLAAKGIIDIQVPLSRERATKPMHVYELHVSALAELYRNATMSNRRPPPLPVSTPIKYSPTDVYYLTRLLVNNMEELYQDTIGTPDFALKNNSGKSPAEVYQELFELYYKLNRLNGKSKISPNEVYAHTFRAKEDLQYTLLTISKRMNDKDEEKKRQLVTAIYGMHPDGTVLTPLEQGKSPANVLEIAFEIRGKLNRLRTKNGLAEIEHPPLNAFSGKVKPIDIFLQSQFIIAELNLLKIPMKIHSTTNSAKPVTGKTPSDVYQVMKHIDYMLDRLLLVL